MRILTQREVANITPVQALFVTALLAVSGASERTRRTATQLFEHSAVSAVWAFLGRHSDARVSWLRLVSVTYEATRRFLLTWPTSGTITIASMMSTLETCTHAVVNRFDDMAPPILPHSRLGVLTLLTNDERLHLLRCVQRVLAPEHQCTLLAVMENNLTGPRDRHAPSDTVVRAVEHLEGLLLQSCAYTLGAPEDFGGPIAA